MDALLKALKNRRGAKIIIIDDEGSMEEMGGMDESMEGMDEEKVMSAKDVLGMEPFGRMKDKPALDMDDEEMMADDEEVELEGLDAEVADERVMSRLRSGKEPKGLTERMNYNLMNKKKG